MSLDIKPLKIWGHTGPNPSKTMLILAELGVPYEVVTVPFSTVKEPEYVKINPNGRLPSMHDPNTDILLWESGAIIEYVMDKYDTKHKLSFPAGSKESYLARQWLFYQVTGQGPYYGQGVWFISFAPDPKIPAAIERYTKEMNRVTAVLEGHLTREKDKGGEGPWLVGGKMSYADLAFITWQRIAATIPTKEQFDLDQYPHVKGWLEKMTSLPKVKEVLDRTDEAMRQGH